MRLRCLLFGAALALATVSARAQVPGYPAFYPPLTSGNCVQASSPFQATTTSAPCGVGSVSAGLINQLAWYAASGNTISGLATANSGVLVTSAGGVPSISSTIPSATQDNITRSGTLVSGATGTGFTVALGSSTITGILPAANGGAGAVTGALKANGSGAVSQAACADLSNGATGCSTAIGTSGATIPLLNGVNTVSATWTFSSAPSVTGTVSAAANSTSIGRSVGNSAIYAYGADTSTNGTLIMNTARSDGSNSATALQVNTDGSISLPATATSTAALDYLCWNATGGKVTADSAGTCLASLEELKDNLGPITPDDARADLLALKPFWGKYKDSVTSISDHRVQPMLGAHQVEAVDARLSSYDGDGNLHGVRYMQLTAILVPVVQAHDQVIADLAERLSAIEKRVAGQ